MSFSLLNGCKLTGSKMAESALCSVSGSAPEDSISTVPQEGLSSPQLPSRPAVREIHTSGSNNPVLLGCDNITTNFNLGDQSKNPQGIATNSVGGDDADEPSVETNSAVSTELSAPSRSSSNVSSSYSRTSSERSLVPSAQGVVTPSLPYQMSTLLASPISVDRINTSGSNNMNIIGGKPHVTNNYTYSLTNVILQGSNFPCGPSDGGESQNAEISNRRISGSNFSHGPSDGEATQNTEISENRRSSASMSLHDSGVWSLPSRSFSDQSGCLQDSSISETTKTHVIDEGVIFLIDCSKEMFQQNTDDADNPFKLSVKCVLSFFTNKAVSNKRDLHSVVLLGTDAKENHGNLENIYMLQELQQVSASQIEELEALLEDSDGVKARYGCNTGFKLADALQACQDIFAECSSHHTKINRKRVFLFTNDDCPNASNPESQHQAKSKAQELYGKGSDVKIQLLHFESALKKFDLSKFYKDFLHTKDDVYQVSSKVPAVFDVLVNRIRPEPKKQCVRKLKFSLGEGRAIGVGIYNLVQECKDPVPVKSSVSADKQAPIMRNEEPAAMPQEVPTTSLQSEEQTAIQEIPNLMDENNAAVNDTSQPSGNRMYYMPYQGKDRYFTEDEKEELSSFDDAGLCLQGFKPCSAIKPLHHIRCPQFIFPDEIMVEGSTCFFSALHQRCLDQDKAIICTLCSHRNEVHVPSVVALLPQEEELDEHGVEVRPPGFCLITLPGASDFRKLPKRIMEKVKTVKACNEENSEKKRLIEKAKALISKLQFSFQSENFENPALKKNWLEDDIIDSTAPNMDYICHRARREIDDFKKCIYPEDHIDKGKNATGLQRESSKANENTVMEEAKMKQYALEGKVNTLTVKVLKAFCTEHRLHRDGKKANLVKEVYGFYNLDPP